MRTLFVVFVLVLLTAPALAQFERSLPDPRTRSSRYDLTYAIWGRVVDADGNFASKYPVTVSVESPDGAITAPLTVITTCYGDFDAYWPLYNVSDRWTARVTTGGQTREQAVDVLHRRNDFAIQLDRSLPPPPESDANCRGAWGLSHHRETFTGQVLSPTPPYKGPADNTLIARPKEGVLVNLKWTEPDGRVHWPGLPIYTNEEGTYKYSFVDEEVNGPPLAGWIEVWFEDEPDKVTNVTVGAEPTHYHVISRPPVRVAQPFQAPGPDAALALLALAGAVALVRRVRR